MLLPQGQGSLVQKWSTRFWYQHVLEPSRRIRECAQETDKNDLRVEENASRCRAFESFLHSTYCAELCATVPIAWPSSAEGRSVWCIKTSLGGKLIAKRTSLIKKKTLGIMSSAIPGKSHHKLRQTNVNGKQDKYLMTTAIIGWIFSHCIHIRCEGI